MKTLEKAAIFQFCYFFLLGNIVKNVHSITCLWVITAMLAGLETFFHITIVAGVLEM